MRTRVIGMEKARARFAWLTLASLGGVLLQGCGFTFWLGGQGVREEIGDQDIPPVDGLILDRNNLELPGGGVRPGDFVNPDDRLDFGGEA